MSPREVKGQTHWSAQEAARYLATGELPVPVPVTKCPVAQVKGTKPGGGNRTVQRVTTGRHHRNIVRDPAWGNRALTGTEAAWLDAHRDVLEHIDIHPTLTLAGGIRYTADFLGWTGTLPTLIECKGSEALARGTDIQRIKLLCAAHPLGPLHIVVWSRKEATWRDV